MDEDIQEQIQKLEKERDSYVTRVFWLCLEIIFIFGIPAAIALIIIFTTGNKQLGWYLLPIAFVLSWIILIMKYRKMAKTLEGLDAKIRELKKSPHTRGQE